MIDVAQLQATLGETIGDGVVRETGIVFFAREALFLSCCHDLAVDDKRGSAIVIKGGHSENAHQTLQAGCISGGRMDATYGKYEEAFKTYAAKYANQALVSVINLTDLFSETDEVIYLDSIHYNERGNALIANRIADDIDALLGDSVNK